MKNHKKKDNKKIRKTKMSSDEVHDYQTKFKSRKTNWNERRESKYKHRIFDSDFS
ncbi:MAG: hypothetical protein QXT97_02460 [Candidatus Diapherotrites archaeon]